MSPGRGIWKGTKGQDLSTFQGMTGCCTGAIYTKAHALGRWLRKKGPTPRSISPQLPTDKSTCAGHSHTGLREYRKAWDTHESIPRSFMG